MKLESLLARGLATLGIELPAAVPAQMLAFLDLLEKWNRRYNLTAVRDPEQMVPRHLLDSLVVLPWLRGARALDIGTGAGLPGIPLALARPDMHFALLDSNAKKLAFVRQAVHELGISNVEVVQARVEAFRPSTLFDTVMARAFSSLAELLSVATPLCAPGGCVLAMKGVFPQEELDEVGAGYRLDVKPLVVPGLDASRHLVIVEPH
jgi:16S rRNA (guanine527-N7)-methyltransferase